MHDVTADVRRFSKFIPGINQKKTQLVRLGSLVASRASIAPRENGSPQLVDACASFSYLPYCLIYLLTVLKTKSMVVVRVEVTASRG